MSGMPWEHHVEYSQSNSLLTLTNYNVYAMNCKGDCREFSSPTASPVWQTQFVLGNKTEHADFTLDAFDQLLGIIGGFISLIWMTFGFVLGSYEEFKLTNDLLG